MPEALLVPLTTAGVLTLTGTTGPELRDNRFSKLAAALMPGSLNADAESSDHVVRAVQAPTSGRSASTMPAVRGIPMRVGRFPACRVEFADKPQAVGMSAGFSTRRIHHVSLARARLTMAPGGSSRFLRQRKSDYGTDVISRAGEVTLSRESDETLSFSRVDGRCRVDGCCFARTTAEPGTPNCCVEIIQGAAFRLSRSCDAVKHERGDRAPLFA